MLRRSDVEQRHAFQFLSRPWVVGRCKGGVHGCNASAHGIVVAEGRNARVVVCYLGVYAGANPFGQFRIEVDAAEGLLVTRPHAQSVLAQCAAR